MTTYIMLTKLTADGSRTMHDQPDRVRAVNEEVEELGCKVVDQYATLGPYDFVTIIEAPDNDAMLRLSAGLGARGTMQILTLPAVPVADFVGGLKGAEGSSRPAI
jgi:uncharacterized protein with GYD domain